MMTQSPHSFFSIFCIDLDNAAKLSQARMVVDHSLVLRAFVKNEYTITVITCPDGLGKTYNLRMIKNFFDREAEDKERFSDLAITKYKNFCLEFQQKYPVIYIFF